MKKTIKNYKGVLAFYILIVAVSFILGARMNHLNNLNQTNNNTIAISK